MNLTYLYGLLNNNHMAAILFPTCAAFPAHFSADRCGRTTVSLQTPAAFAAA